jgi:Ca2+-transporting ATPase
MDKAFFHSMSIDKIFDRLKTSHNGLTSEEAKERLNVYGKNILKEVKVSNFKIFLRQFNSILVYILVFASLISLVIGEWLDFFVISFIIFVNSMIGFWQEVRAEISLRALKKLTETRNKILRDKEILFVNSSELVPGDFIVLHEGEVVTADIRLVESSGLMIDEASLTGESTPVIKDYSNLLPEETLPYDLTNMLLAGSNVVRGAAKGVIVATGINTYLANIAKKAEEQSPETSLTKALNFFSKRYVIALVILFSCLMVLGYLQGRSVLDLSYIMLANLVSAVPEGLPIVVTLVMTLGAVTLSHHKALVRYLPAVETLGSATFIATDKTGTITEGNLVVKEVHTEDEKTLNQIASLCNDAHEGLGDPMDVALSDWVDNYCDQRKNYPRKWSHSFDVKTMLMGTVNEIDNEERLLVKGAYESLKNIAENKDELDEKFHSLLEKGLRVVAFGSGKWEKKEDPSLWKIKIIGLIGFFDPPKEGVKESVISAKKAGIKVIMITGDHPKTAKAIAKEVNIFCENDSVLLGKEIEIMSDEDLIKSLKTTTVLARILPEHKHRVVKLLQSNGEIVAVTGDGINDIPALKVADLGIAMGGGTEAAKSVSKIVITDNNFKVIVSAIKTGRIIADNIRKVIYYLVSTSLQDLCVIAFSLFSFYPIPLAAVQILWINFVTDGVQDKMFPFAKEDINVMARKPKKPEKQFFDSRQVTRMLVFGGFMGLLCFFLYIYIFDKYSFAAVSTIVFTSSVSAQWANGIQAQKEMEPFFKNIKKSFTINPWIFLGMGLGVILQCFVIYIIPGLFHSYAMTLDQWKYPIFIFFAAFFLVEIRKWVEVLFYKKKC